MRVFAKMDDERNTKILRGSTGPALRIIKKTTKCSASDPFADRSTKYDFDGSAVAGPVRFGLCQRFGSCRCPACIRLTAPALPEPASVPGLFPPPVLRRHIACPYIGDEAGPVPGSQLMDLMRRRYRVHPGTDMACRLRPPVADRHRARQHAVYFQRRMLMQRIGHMRGEQEHPEKKLGADQRPPLADDLRRHQA